jgi:hypothetical protein
VCLKTVPDFLNRKVANITIFSLLSEMAEHLSGPKGAAPQLLESRRIYDFYSAPGRLHNTLLAQLAHYADRCFGCGPDQISHFLIGKMQGWAEFFIQHKKHVDYALFGLFCHHIQYSFIAGLNKTAQGLDYI